MLNLGKIALRNRYLVQKLTLHRGARQSVPRQRKELWSWNKNQNVALEQMKSSYHDSEQYNKYNIPNFFKACYNIPIIIKF